VEQRVSEPDVEQVARPAARRPEADRGAGLQDRGNFFQSPQRATPSAATNRRFAKYCKKTLQLLSKQSRAA
jgi:hypothetical protein